MNEWLKQQYSETRQKNNYQRSIKKIKKKYENKMQMIRDGL